MGCGLNPLIFSIKHLRRIGEGDNEGGAKLPSGEDPASSTPLTFAAGRANPWTESAICLTATLELREHDAHLGSRERDEIGLPSSMAIPGGTESQPRRPGTNHQLPLPTLDEAPHGAQSLASSGVVIT